MIRCIWQLIALTGLLITLSLGQPSHASAQQPSGPVYTVEVQGTITSVTIDHLRRALRLAEASNANALLIRLSASGGVLRAMRPFATELAAARVPVVVHVAPAGTRSGAAGALFLSAAHISALAPNTSFGSPYPLAQVDSALSQQTRDLVLDSVVDQLREWNAERGRNTEWVDRAVREGILMTNEQAIAANPPAVDVVAADQQQLLTLLDGRIVKLENGREVQLVTLGRPETVVEPTLWEALRLLLANPTIAFTLLVLGALSIYMEFAVPGTSVFLGVGLVLLVGAGLGLLVLPIRWWSFVLLLFAFGLVGAEFFVPAHGGLAVTGLALMIVGAINLIDPVQAPGVLISTWVVLLIALGLACFAALGVWLALRTRERPVTTGPEAMIGRLAQVRERLDPEGMVFVEGALWKAIGEDGIAEPGEWVRIAAIHDLHLIVQRIDIDERPAGDRAIPNS